MTDQTTPASAGAQPIVDVNSIDSIIDEAIAETSKEGTPAEPTEPTGQVETKEDTFPKKAINALSRRDKQIGKLKAQYDQAMQELNKVRQQAQQPNQGGELSPAKTGIPSKLNQNSFTNYADYIEARAEEIADYKIDKRFAEHDGKQKEAQQSQQELAWESERSSAVDKMADEFAKEAPELPTLFEEYADVIREYPKELKHALLAADNPPLAFYNLAKEGKLEDLASMSLVDAKVEIRLAQMKQFSKPKTKAPIPLAASRGSVASGKRVDDMSGKELREWLKSD